MMLGPLRTESPRESTDGFVLIAVLWLLGTLATLVSIYAVYVIQTGADFKVHDEGLQAEALVSAAVELTAGQLIRGPARQQHGQFGFSMDRASVAVEFASETARIDLNAAPKELLTGLFEVVGATPAAAKTYADRVIGWRTAPPQGDDPEGDAYRSAHKSYLPRQAPFPHADELSLVLGIPPTLVERALALATVYSGRPQINVVEASPEVVAALPGMTPDRLKSLLAERQRARGDDQALLSLLGPARKFATTDDCNTRRVKIDISFDSGRQVSAEVVILLFESGDEPYAVLSWRDLSDQPTFPDQSLTSSQ